MTDLRHRLDDMTRQAVRDAAVPAVRAVAARGRRHRRRQLAAAALVMAGLVALAALTVPALRSLQSGQTAVTPAGPGPLPALPLAPTGPAGNGYGLVDTLVGVDSVASPGQRRELERLLRTSPLVDALWFESRAAAWARYNAQFAGQPSMLEGLSEEQMSESYLLRLTDPSRLPGLKARLCPAGRSRCLPGVGVVADVYQLRREVLVGTYWPARADLSVLLTLTVSDAQRRALADRIAAMPMVASVTAETGAEALARLPGDERGRLSAEHAPMPPSLRVRLDRPDQARAFHLALCQTMRTGDCAPGIAVVYEHPRRP